MRRLFPLFFALAVACAGEPPAQEEVLAWDQVDQLDGKWVRHEPCGAALGFLEVDPGAKRVVWGVGQEEMEYELLDRASGEAGLRLDVKSQGESSRLELRPSEDGRATLTNAMGTWTFAPRRDRDRYPLLSEQPCELE